jgi:hypothetical protein
MNSNALKEPLGYRFVQYKTTNVRPKLSVPSNKMTDPCSANK